MKLAWDESGKKFFETGVSKAVLYLQDSTGAYPEGVAWSGITAVNESPSGAEATKLWADNTVYATLVSAEEFGASVEAYMYPDEFKKCNGELELATGVIVGQQARASFGLCYQTIIGNDINSELGYKINIIYGAKVAPSEKAHSTVNESPEAATMSWEISTTPVNVTGKKPTAFVSIDSTTVDADKLAAFEAIIYGSESAAARLPLPDEIATLFSTEG